MSRANPSNFARTLLSASCVEATSPLPPNGSGGLAAATATNCSQGRCAAACLGRRVALEGHSGKASSETGGGCSGGGKGGGKGGSATREASSCGFGGSGSAAAEASSCGDGGTGSATAEASPRGAGGTGQRLPIESPAGISMSSPAGCSTGISTCASKGWRYSGIGSPSPP